MFPIEPHPKLPLSRLISRSIFHFSFRYYSLPIASFPIAFLFNDMTKTSD